MATSVLGLKTFTASDPVDYNEINDNYNKIDTGVKTALQGRAAHNLLDNSDFTNSVNQRGATTATLGKYFIDRWNTEAFHSGPSITIDSNGLTLLPTTGYTAGIFQNIPDYEKRKGKIHTFAICVGNEWKCVPFTMGNFGVGYQIHGLYFFSVDSQHILIRNIASDNPAPITIQRVALYEGSYDASTLPAYQPKENELAECMRYYYQSNDSKQGQDGMIIRRATNIDSGTNSYCLESVDLPVPMRITPTITVYDDYGNANCVKEMYSNNKVSNTSIRYANNRSFCVASEAGGFVGGKSYFFQYTASADL